VIRTRMPCLIKLVSRQRSVHGVGVGRVMSEGVYFMLQVYTFSFLANSFLNAGENLRSALPLVGVDLQLAIPSKGLLLGIGR